MIGAAGSPPPDLESLTVVSEGLAVAAPPGHPPLAGVTAPALLALVWRAGPGPAVAGLLRHCRQASGTAP
jgi:hypothetical protein